MTRNYFKFNLGSTCRIIGKLTVVVSIVEIILSFHFIYDDFGDENFADEYSEFKGCKWVYVSIMNKSIK